MFIILMILFLLIFGRFIFITAHAALSVGAILLMLVLFPVIFIVLLLTGLFVLALPVLIIVGIISLIVRH